MKTNMKRILCLALAALMLLAFAACKKKDEKKEEDPNKPKKDQVVHEGETVQYGNLKFRFEKACIAYSHYHGLSLNKAVMILLECENNSDSSKSIYHFDFKIYADGIQTDSSSNISGYNIEGTGYDERYSSVKMSSNRSGSLWIAVVVPIEAKTVEFDFDDYYSDQWGKVTFVVDTPQDYKPEEDWIVGTWIKHSEGGLGWNENEHKYVFGKGGTGYYTYTEAGEQKESISFTYRYLSEDYVFLTYEDGCYDAGYYDRENGQLNINASLSIQKTDG